MLGKHTGSLQFPSSSARHLNCPAEERFPLLEEGPGESLERLISHMNFTTLKMAQDAPGCSLRGQLLQVLILWTYVLHANNHQSHCVTEIASLPSPPPNFPVDYTDQVARGHNSKGTALGPSWRAGVTLCLPRSSRKVREEGAMQSLQQHGLLCCVAEAPQGRNIPGS